MWQAALLPLSEPDRPGKRIVIANGRVREHNNTTPAPATTPAPVPAAAPTPAALPCQLAALSLNQTQYGCPRLSSRNGQTKEHGQKREQGKSRRGEQEHKEREETWGNMEGRNNLKRLKSSAALGRQSGRAWPSQVEMLA